MVYYNITSYHLCNTQLPRMMRVSKAWVYRVNILELFFLFPFLLILPSKSPQIFFENILAELSQNQHYVFRIYQVYI